MARKEIELMEPAQLGFGFEVQDEQGNRPPFLYEEQEVEAAIKEIEQVQWVSVDVETTGLTSASMPVNLDKKALQQGASNRVRLRTIQVRIPTVEGRRGPRKDMAFDTDKMSSLLVQKLASAILTRRLFIAHNAGFDLYWLRQVQGRTIMPEFVADTMLLTRALRPEHSLMRAQILSDAGIRSPKDMVNSDDEVLNEAWKSIISGASGGSLADVVLAFFDVAVPKQYQMPKNWAGLLTFEHYTYAIDDVVWGDRILTYLFEQEQDEGDLLRGYLGARARNTVVRLLEPQVPDLVVVREKGLPFNNEISLRYAQLKENELAGLVDRIIDVEPSLEPYREALEDPNAGRSDKLNRTLAAAFESRGVMLRYTAATRAPQVGEKDLRACKAARIPAAKSLFDAWVAINRAKKTRQMALETAGFSRRSDTGRLHSLLSHGPVTGRLSASEPNCQQWPRDPLFRAMCMSPVREGREHLAWTVTEASAEYFSFVRGQEVVAGQEVTVPSGWAAACFYGTFMRFSWPGEESSAYAAFLQEHFTHGILASDFGALDVRVGAALCIRAQRDMIALAHGTPLQGKVQPRPAVSAQIKSVVDALESPTPEESLNTLERILKVNCQRIETRLEVLKEQFDTRSVGNKAYYSRRRTLNDELLAVKLGWRLAQCLGRGMARGEKEYSALRDAFVADIDIHTFTGMKLAGRDPMAEFEGLTGSELKAKEREVRAEIGEGRQQGKIANLSLLYGMGVAGFQEAAASGYDEHWTMDESEEIRSLWLDAYPEVELWQLWTQSLCAGTIYVPEAGRDYFRRTDWWVANTLGGRNIVAFGINSALSYQDQSSGADILSLILTTLRKDYPEVFDTIINQVHDELVFSIPVEQLDEFAPLIERIMVDTANSLTMPFGVPTKVGVDIAPLWYSD